MHSHNHTDAHTQTHTHSRIQCCDSSAQHSVLAISVDFPPFDSISTLFRFYSILRIFMRCHFFFHRINDDDNDIRVGFFSSIEWWLLCVRQSKLVAMMQIENDFLAFIRPYSSGNAMRCHATATSHLQWHTRFVPCRVPVPAHSRCSPTITDVSSNIQNSHAYRLRSEFFMELLWPCRLPSVCGEAWNGVRLWLLCAVASDWMETHEIRNRTELCIPENRNLFLSKVISGEI